MKTCLTTVHLVFIFIAVLAVNISHAFNDGPVIGILSQKSSRALAKYGKSYIAASYVKFLELAGARVVPILMNQPDSYYYDMFSSLNGVLLPGGAQRDVFESQYGRVGLIFYQLSIKNYDAHGIHFPIWATCLGFHLLMKITSKQNILKPTDSRDLPLPLTFAKDVDSSRLFHAADKSILDNLASKNVTYHNHRYSLLQSDFRRDAALRAFYRPLATNVDRNGVSFISVMEAVNYPIYAVVFHPEKTIFEWKYKNINRSPEAIAVTHFFAEFFVAEARLNNHTFSWNHSQLIYSYSPVYTAATTTYMQCYFFDV